MDDSTEVLQALRRQLRGSLEDVRIELAPDATRALARLAALQPSPDDAVVIVSDWLMPGIRGEELIHTVTDQWGRIPTIVLSGHIDPETRARLIAVPAVARVLPKPWEADTLVELVRALLSDESPAQPPPAGAPDGKPRAE